MGSLEMEGLIYVRTECPSSIASRSANSLASCMFEDCSKRRPRAWLVRASQVRRLNGCEEMPKSVSAGQDLDQTFDNDLHDTILFYSGNEVLAAIVKQLRKKTAIFNIRRIPRRAAPVAGEHMAIIGALERRDQAGVRNAVTVHIDNVRESIIAWISNIGSDSAR